MSSRIRACILVWSIIRLVSAVHACTRSSSSGTMVSAAATTTTTTTTTTRKNTCFLAPSFVPGRSKRDEADVAAPAAANAFRGATTTKCFQNTFASIASSVPFATANRHCSDRRHSATIRRATRQSDSFVETSAHSPSVTGVTLKIAVDTNGGVACRSEIKPERFTSPESLDMVHRLRACSDAVLIGVGTAIADNPSLLVRRNVPLQGKHQQPLRVVIDPTLKLLLPRRDNEKYQLLTDGYPVVIYHCVGDPNVNENLGLSSETQRIPARNVQLQQPVLPPSVRIVYIEPQLGQPQQPALAVAPSSETLIGNTTTTSTFKKRSIMGVRDILSDLRRQFGVQHLMVEGGPVTAQAFLQANLVDRCLVVRAPISFTNPIPSGISHSVLSQSMTCLGSIPSGVDTIDVWSSRHVPWPTEQLHDWP